MPKRRTRKQKIAVIFLKFLLVTRYGHPSVTLLVCGANVSYRRIRRLPFVSVCVCVGVCWLVLPLNWMGGHLNILIQIHLVLCSPDIHHHHHPQWMAVTATTTVLSLSRWLLPLCVAQFSWCCCAAVSQFVSGKIVFFISRTHNERHRHQRRCDGGTPEPEPEPVQARAPFGTLIKRYSSGRFIAPCGSNVAKWGWLEHG